MSIKSFKGLQEICLDAKNADGLDREMAGILCWWQERGWDGEKDENANETEEEKMR